MPWATVLFQQAEKTCDQDVARQQAAASAFVQLPGTKHHTMIGHLDPQPRHWSLAANVENHQNPRPFLFHPDVSRAPRAKLTVRSTDFVLLRARLPAQYEQTPRL